MSSRVLAISSSRVGNSAYLERAVPKIRNFLGASNLNIAFIPFASVDANYEDYLENVREGLGTLPHTIQLVEVKNAKSVIEQCDVVMVGGGNTFKLLHDIYQLQLFELIKQKVLTGTPYIGWSAGANITGKTIGTTNDMPIIEPKSFKAFNFFPFQINPHYLNTKPEGHNGETRDQRIAEFIQLNPAVPVVGLPEGTALKLKAEQLEFIGEASGVLFKSGGNSKEIIRSKIIPGEDLSHLLS